MSTYLGDKLIAGSFKAGASWEVGDVGISAFGIDEALNKRRYLNGQVISQTQFVQFTAFLKSRVSVYPSLATTEVNWQATVTNSDLGQCGQFVIDDVAGTIRLPKVVNINGLQNLTGLGTIKAESLPNIKGGIGFGATAGNAPVSGAFYNDSNSISGIKGTSATIYPVSLDASLSSSTYQDNAPVQQEAVQYPYFIQVAEGVETSVDVSREIELNNPFSLLDYKFSEYELSNASWLLSNGQWNNGAVYQSVYELLLQIYNGTVTKAGVSVKLSTEAYTDTDFVLNTGDTTFRLPVKVKLPNSKGVAGNGITLGFTNSDGVDADMARSGQNYAIVRLRNNVSSYPAGPFYVATDPTKSGIEVKDDSSMYLYFYVGETIQDANIIVAASVLTKVANCIDKTVESDRETVVGWGMPDYSSGIYIGNLPYTAPCDGYINTHIVFNVGDVRLYVNGVEINLAGGGASAGFDYLFPVSKDDVISSSSTSTFNVNDFYPCKGV